MHSISLNGKPVATLHVLLTAPWSDRNLVCVQKTKGTFDQPQLSLFDRLFSKMNHSVREREEAMDDASKGLDCVLEHVRKIDRQVSGSTTSIATILPVVAGSRLFLTSGKQWGDTLDASLRIRQAQLRTVVDACANQLGMGTTDSGEANGLSPIESELEKLSDTKHSINTIFYEHSEREQFQQVGADDFPGADHIH